jgi:heat shock protein HslJ/membrane-bound inhibitor of C-type lysozyme
VADWRRTLLGQQLPIRFELVYDPAQIDAARNYGVRAAIIAGGQPQWASEAKPVTLAGGGGTEAGTLLLAPYQALAFASTLDCGGRQAQFGIARRDGQDLPQLVVGSRRYDLRQVPAASGARYEAIGDPRTSLWNKGERTTVTVGGEVWPECETRKAAAAAAAPAAAPLRLRGNEPFWLLEIGATMTLRTPDSTLEGPAPQLQAGDGFRRYEGSLQGRPISATVRYQRCVDTMSGMPYPLSAEVRFDGRSLKGCGGDPVELLLGPEWVVEEITGGWLERSRATLAFGADGRLSGRASCNSFFASYTLTGEGLGIGQTGTTRMACAPELMQQEARFLDILQKVQRFEIAADGALVLASGDGRRIKARRGP